MSSDLYFILAVMVAGFAGLFWLVNRKLSERKQDNSLVEWLKSTQVSVDATNKAINEALRSSSQDINKTLHANTQVMNERLDNAAKYISDVAKQVGAMSEIGRSMKDLQEFLRSPKLRGNIGEEVLHDLISQMFPKNSFYLQYGFKSGEKVDAALKTDAGILPIDSKFPMENFRRMTAEESESERLKLRKLFVNDVRKHIRDISKKYILPEEGTMDFAIMYIPSEPVYYEVVNEPELIDYARAARVYVVSPSTMYAMLQTILLSFEGKKIEAQSRKIFGLLRSIQSDYQKTADQLAVLGRHVGNAYTKMNDVNQAYGLMGQKLSQTQMLGGKTEVGGQAGFLDEK
jgi:DNA recombination protein RmuC